MLKSSWMHCAVVAAVECCRGGCHSTRWRLRNEEVLMKHISHERDLISRPSAAFRDLCIFVSSANRGGKLTAFSKHADGARGGTRWTIAAELLSFNMHMTCKLSISSITKPCGNQSDQSQIWSWPDKQLRVLLAAFRFFADRRMGVFLSICRRWSVCFPFVLRLPSLPASNFHVV